VKSGTLWGFGGFLRGKREGNHEVHEKSRKEKMNMDKQDEQDFVTSYRL
jgi:hypothetical protein